jgi:hypothetical protein
MAKYPSTESSLGCSTSLSLSVSLPFCWGRGDSLVPKRQWKLRQIITADVVQQHFEIEHWLSIVLHASSTTGRAPFLPWWSFESPTEPPCPTSHDDKRGPCETSVLTSWLSPSLLLRYSMHVSCVDEEDDEDDADNDDGSCCCSSIAYY